MNPKTELTKFFNRAQNYNFNFEKDIADFYFFQEIIKAIQKEINKNLLKRPDTTCNYLISIDALIEKGQKFIHKRFILDIQERIQKEGKNPIITPEENENYENASIFLNDLEDIKELIFQTIKSVKPELIKKPISKTPQPKKEAPEEHSSEKEIKDNKLPPRYLKPKGIKYFQFEVAFYLFFKKKKINNPDTDTTQKLKLLVSKEFGFDSDTSAKQLYFRFYIRIKKASEEEVTIEKIIDSISLKTDTNSKTIEKYIKNIIVLLNPEEQKEANKYLKELDLMNN